MIERFLICHPDSGIQGTKYKPRESLPDHSNALLIFEPDRVSLSPKKLSNEEKLRAFLDTRPWNG